MDFSAFAAAVRHSDWRVIGAEVYEAGRLSHSMGDTTGRHPIYSATKTITSLAVGMAEDDGRLELSRLVTDYLPRETVAAMSRAQWETYRHVTLHRLMCMSVRGYPFRVEGGGGLRDAALACALPAVEQPAFAYSNVPAYLAGVAAACALDEPLEAFLQRRLFDPLGIAPPVFTRCPDGFFYGASGMELSVNELSRIGLVVYQRGVYEGRRIVSEGYLRRACAVQQMNREGGYGYFLWKYRGGWSINGKWGQKCYILPQEGRMITFLSDNREQKKGLRTCMEQHLLEQQGGAE